MTGIAKRCRLGVSVGERFRFLIGSFHLRLTWAGRLILGPCTAQRLRLTSRSAWPAPGTSGTLAGFAFGEGNAWAASRPPLAQRSGVGKALTAGRTLHANLPTIILEFLEVHGKILKKIKCLKLKLIKMYKLKLPYNMSKKITKIFVQ